MEVTHEALTMAEADPMDDHDRWVIANEQAFRARFGFDRARRDREHLIQLKHDLDLTDREIRLMWRSASLSFGPHEARLNASRWMALYGRLVIAFLVLMALHACHLASLQGSVTFLLIVKLVVLAVIFVALGKFIEQTSIRPWLIQKRVQSRLHGG